jgi:DNA topoisomerase-1
MSLDTITLEEALTLLTLPRLVGVDPETGEEITAQNGRYGPYLKKGTDSRSIDSEEKLLTITLEEARAIYAQPKQRGRAAANPGKEIGKDPVSGNMVLMKSGRFGTYVTDGEYNATLRQGDDEASLTIERAAELLEERRAKGPAKKAAKKSPTAKRTPAKKTTTAKTTAAKKTTKKTTAKKSTARSSAATP